MERNTVDIEVYKKIVAKIENMDYGETITHEQFADELGLIVKTQKYYQAMAKLCNMCLDIGKMLECVNRYGYKITYPDDYASSAVVKYKHGFNRLKKGEKILKHAPVNDMSEHGRTAYRLIADRASALTIHMSGAIVELKLLQKQHPFIEAGK